MCLMNERKTGENAVFDIQSRVENLLWAVSGDYGLDMPADIKAWEKSPYIPLYEAVVQAGRQFFRFHALEFGDLPELLVYISLIFY